MLDALRFLIGTPKSESNIGMSRIYAHHELKWDGLQLRLKSGRLLATVEPTTPNMKECLGFGYATAT